MTTRECTICRNSFKALGFARHRAMHMEERQRFTEKLVKKYGTCKICGRAMHHLEGIHTFVCRCGQREWYVERFLDSYYSTTMVNKE